MLLDATDKLNTDVNGLCLGVSRGFLDGVGLMLDIAKIVLRELQLKQIK